MAVLRSSDDGEPCTLRFISQRQGQAVRVLWVDYEGEEKEYGRLEELCFFNQDTYVNHPWRLRDAATGQLLAEYCGPTATVTLLPDGTTRVQAGLHRPPPAEVRDPRWGVFRQRGSALGIPILAFDCVCQEAADAAAALVDRMLGCAPLQVVAAMNEAGAEVAIIGRDQVTTDLPMYRHLRGVRCSNGGGDYDQATRGLGGNPGNPTTSCGEENLLMLEGDRYPCENILVHEFGHAVMDLGLHGHPLRAAIIEAYRAAPRRAECGRKGGPQQGDSSSKQSNGKIGEDKDSAMDSSGEDGKGDEWAGYDPASYIMANECEYWAEGTQAWFDATVRTDVTSGVNTREKLVQRDPLLAAILEQVYGNTRWRYPHTAPRAFASSSQPSKRQRANRKGAAGTAAAVTTGGTAGAAVHGVQDNPSQPLLQDAGVAAASVPTARQGVRRKRGSLGKGGGSASGSADGAGKGDKPSGLQRRVTRAFARLAGCMCCFPA